MELSRPLRVTLRQLQVFVAVARHGTTTAASRELSLSQSATSSAIGELERLLGIELFERQGRNLHMNDHARALLPQAEAIVESAHGLADLACQTHVAATAVRIGASTTIGNYVLPGLLARYFAGDLANPGSWQSQVVIGNTAAICEALDRFELDVGLIEGPCHVASLEVRSWLTDELVVVAAPSHPVHRTANGRSTGQSPADLAQHVWLVREAGSGTRETSDAVLLPQVGAYRRCIELASSEAIKRAVAQGLGIACLSRFAAEDFLDAGHLRIVELTLPRITRAWSLVMRRGKTMTPALAAFERLLTKPGNAPAPIAGQS